MNIDTDITNPSNTASGNGHQPSGVFRRFGRDFRNLVGDDIADHLERQNRMARDEREARVRGKWEDTWEAATGKKWGSDGANAQVPEAGGKSTVAIEQTETVEAPREGGEGAI